MRDMVSETANTEHERMTINSLGVLRGVYSDTTQLNSTELN